MKSKYANGIYQRYQAPYVYAMDHYVFPGRRYVSPKFSRQYYSGRDSWRNIVFSVDINFYDEQEMEAVRQQILARTYAVAM